MINDHKWKDRILYWSWEYDEEDEEFILSQIPSIKG